VATDKVDAVIVELKKATVFGKRCFRGWPPASPMYPCCGVQENVEGEPTVDRALARWTIQIDSWARDATSIVAVKAAIKVVADTYHAVVHHRSISETGMTHIVSTLDVLGGS
jgi:hypothetical protein